MLIDSGQHEEAQEAVRVAASALDKAASKGVIHKNNAARRKSRLAQRLIEVQRTS
jgi:small subunit ribosomal protein S20